MAVSGELDRKVRRRARGLCEYGRLPQAAYPWTFQVDHIIAEQHRGKTRLNNLALACPHCNRCKDRTSRASTRRPAGSRPCSTRDVTDGLIISAGEGRGSSA